MYIIDRDGVAAEDDEPFDYVAQFADIAAPPHRRERLHGVGVDRLGRDAVEGRDFVDEVLRQFGNVGGAFAQGRDADDDDAETVVEVFAEIPLGDLLAQVLVGGCDHPYVDVDVLVASHAADLVLLEGAQYFGLGRERHVADLVHEERTARGLFELALALFDGRGEGAAFVAEEFAFDQLRGNGRAVDFDEGARSPSALGVEPAGDQLLAGPVLAGDEGTGIEGCDPFDDLPHVADGVRRADDGLHGRGARAPGAPHRMCGHALFGERRLCRSLLFRVTP